MPTVIDQALLKKKSLIRVKLSMKPSQSIIAQARSELKQQSSYDNN